MRFPDLRVWVPTAVCAVGLLAGAAPRVDAQTSTVTGRVTAKENGQPLSDVRVVVVSSNVFAISGVDGRYTLRNVASGGVDIRVLRVGYQEQKKRITLAPGQNETLDFILEQTIVRLQEVVTTATGQQRRVELGNTVSTLDASKRVAEAPVKNFGDLLAAKEPGVQILPNNMTGGGSRVRIRGTASFTLTNDPIYVIDGIRMTSGNSNGTGASIGVGGTTPNRVSDINPEEIENIEIVKGPSAATLYGTDASNGVIVITTKKGRAGAARWSVFAEHGQIQDRNTYPSQWVIFGHNPATPATTRRCSLVLIGLGNCIQDSTASLNLFKDQDTSPIKLGSRDNYGAQVSGGTEAVRYFISTDIQKEVGPFGLPAFNKRAFDSLGVAIQDYWYRPNSLGQASFRGNVNAVVTSQLDIAVNMGFTKIDQRLPQVDNNINSFWYNGETGPGFKKAGPGYTGTGSIGQQLNGYANFTPGEIFQYLTTQGVQRFIGGTTFNWRPLAWLQGHGDIGLDLADRDEFQLCRLAQCPDFGTQRLGFATDARTNIRNFTTNLGATGTWNPTTLVSIKSTLGMQYVNFKSDRTTGQGLTLPPGAETPASGTTPAVFNRTEQQNTLGFFIEEQAAIRDRLFLTAALRTDQNSAFGTNFQRVYYPKGSLSWILSEESFFPKARWLDQFRLRASVGSSGVQPGPVDALRTFQPTTTSVAATDISGLLSQQLGNANLKPERATEFEGGIDTRVLNNRVNIELTYYNKRSKDAVFDLTIAPSTGSPQTAVRTNLGGIQNTGFEGLINAQVIDGREFGLDLTLAASHQSNKLISLGTDAAGNPIPPVGLNTGTQERSGYPLFGAWARPYTYSDLDGNGIITPNEVIVDTTWRFHGYQQPRDEIALTTGIELLGRKLRFNILTDYKGGSVLFNNLEGFLCPQAQSASGCAYNANPKASLADQARAVAATNKGTLNTNWGFQEPLRFWRIREITATYTFSDQFAAKYLRMRGGSVNFGVRNIKVFTKYSGTDPEANYAEGNTQNTLLTAGPPTYFQFRLNLRY
ncbi:MAG TPA: SusC/RagA family TonB-linked outer membrane protein [Gemmatimonadaceae bacterium]|nr:SusC/RagA family TonB-linked outer membrane protein [Gemmatimonadaceae bacterium]